MRKGLYRNPGRAKEVMIERVDAMNDYYRNGIVPMIEILRDSAREDERIAQNHRAAVYNLKFTLRARAEHKRIRKAANRLYLKSRASV